MYRCCIPARWFGLSRSSLSWISEDAMRSEKWRRKMASTSSSQPSCETSRALLRKLLIHAYKVCIYAHLCCYVKVRRICHLCLEGATLLQIVSKEQKVSSTHAVANPSVQLRDRRVLVQGSIGKAQSARCRIFHHVQNTAFPQVSTIKYPCLGSGDLIPPKCKLWKSTLLMGETRHGRNAQWPC